MKEKKKPIPFHPSLLSAINLTGLKLYWFFPDWHFHEFPNSVDYM